MTRPIIVITGPIASGKTTVAEVMAGENGLHLPADNIAHEAFLDDRVRDDLHRSFGDSIFDGKGKVSNRALAARVFEDPEAMEKLNGIVKPAVTSIIEREVETRSPECRYIVLDAVLFFEYKFKFNVDMVVLVDAPVDVRLNRLMKRDGISENDARARISGQKYLESGWAGSDVTIDSSADLEQVRRRASEIRDRFIRANAL